MWYCKSTNYSDLGRIQGILWRHVDVAIVDVTQHGLKSLFTWNHLPNGDINLTVFWHERAKHCFKVTGVLKSRTNVRNIILVSQASAQCIVTDNGGRCLE